jgi:ribosome-binding protein aMBF1 (putative translation factor)
MEFQDWQTVVLKKAPPKTKKPQLDYQGSRIKKVENEEFVLKTYDLNFIDNVKQYRRTNELTQKQLAIKINVREDIIKSMEAGKGLYDPKIVSTLKRLMK